ncbi:glycosyl hydrolase family 8, partial [Pseudorhodobacter sp.]|uniref:glycosyl hydrolase family 8 n=1 Tax=Pseudorhodobacter sp. TaxID=1934400 RepID=UPI0026483367
MNRRSFMRVVTTTAVALAAPRLALAGQRRSIAGAIAQGHPLQKVWQAWKALCMLPEGRIVDQLQGAASHSEGQGYGLTL